MTVMSLQSDSTLRHGLAHDWFLGIYHCFKCCHCQVHRSLIFDTWLRHVLCYDCPWSPFSHVFKYLDHSPKISDDFPNIIAWRFYERIKMFPELFLTDSDISEPCRRPRLRGGTFTGTIIKTLRTFAPIVSAHRYCARESHATSCHVMHRARALSNKMNKW